MLMNKVAYYIEDKTLGIKVIEPNDKYLKMKVIYENDEQDNEDNECNNETNEEESEFNEKEQLIITIKLMCVKDNEEYNMAIYKKRGDRFEYHERLNEIKKLTNKLL